jgi:hypothetical protein
VIIIVRERSAKCEEPYGVVRSSTGWEDQPCSWVSREGRDREKREDLLVKSAYQNYMLSS